MNKKTIPIIILALILIIVGVVFGLQKNKAPVESEKVIKTATSTKETLSEIDTSNWKTYRNEKFGFEVRYPAYWKVMSENDKNNQLLIVIGNRDKNKKIHGYEGDIFIGVEDKNINSLEDILKRLGKRYALKTENITINGLPAFKIHKTMELTNRPIRGESIIIYGIKNRYSISYTLSPEKNIIFQEIYNSFKILK